MIDYGLYTSRPLSARHQRCYSSLQCFCFIQFITYRGSYIIGQPALSSVFCCKMPAFSQSGEIAQPESYYEVSLVTAQVSSAPAVLNICFGVGGGGGGGGGGGPPPPPPPPPPHQRAGVQRALRLCPRSGAPWLSRSESLPGMFHNKMLILCPKRQATSMSQQSLDVLFHPWPAGKVRRNPLANAPT